MEGTKEAQDEDREANERVTKAQGRARKAMDEAKEAEEKSMEAVDRVKEVGEKARKAMREARIAEVFRKAMTAMTEASRTRIQRSLFDREDHLNWQDLPLPFEVGEEIDLETNNKVMISLRNKMETYLTYFRWASS